MAVFADSAQPLTTAAHFISRLGDEANATLATARRNLSAKPATLVDLVTPDAQTEYWLGFRNFYAITRYNRSYFYAMAVFQLSQELRQG